MNSGAERVRAALIANGVVHEVMEFPQGTRSAEDAARAIGTTLGQIVKSLVFLADGRPVLVLVSGKNRVDIDKLSFAAGATHIKRADADQVRDATGFVIGGVPPVGHVARLETFIDEDLVGYEVVFAATGTPTTIFPVTPADLVRITEGRHRGSGSDAVTDYEFDSRQSIAWTPLISDSYQLAPG